MTTIEPTEEHIQFAINLAQWLQTSPVLWDLLPKQNDPNEILEFKKCEIMNHYLKSINKQIVWSNKIASEAHEPSL